MATLSSSQNLSSEDQDFAALCEAVSAEVQAQELGQRRLVMELAGAGWVRADLPGATDEWRGPWGQQKLDALWDLIDWDARLMTDSKGRLFIFVGHHSHIAPTQEAAARVRRFYS